jgi:hypothetical protein
VGDNCVAVAFQTDGGDLEGGTGDSPPGDGAPVDGGDASRDGGETPGPTSLVWVPIAGGTFQMGASDITYAQPVHSVTVPSFEMLQTEVTVSQYAQLDYMGFRCARAGQ